MCATSMAPAHAMCLPCRVDLVLHYISITWKLIAAFIPPADWRKAYPAFFLSLVELVGIIYILQEVRARPRRLLRACQALSARLLLLLLLCTHSVPRAPAAQVAYAFGCEVLLSPIMNGITLVAMGAWERCSCPAHTWCLVLLASRMLPRMCATSLRLRRAPRAPAHTVCARARRHVRA